MKPELIDRIKRVAPGTLLRQALDDILKAEFGALIVFLDDIREQETTLRGGFYIGASFSPEKLYELAKMDGAIILDAVPKLLWNGSALPVRPGGYGAPERRPMGRVTVLTSSRM